MSKPLVARHDMAVGVGTNVFAGSPKRAINPDETRLLRRIYEFGALILTVRFPAQVGVPHETLLLTLLHLLEKRGALEPFAGQLQEVEGISLTRDIARLEITANELLTACGLPNNQGAYDRLERHLTELSLVHLHVASPDMYGASTILGYCWDRKNGEKIRVNLCWRFAASVLGQAQFCLINLDERQALSTDVAKTIHRWISSHRWQGKSADYQLSTLIEKAWRDPASSDQMLRKRRHILRKVLAEEIGNLPGWSVEIDGERIRIKRP